jgi:quercetin dioxygenase-like cupin family protein
LTDYHIDTLTAREVAPGFRAKFVHSETMTVAYWQVSAGARLPAHSHPHEQVVNMMEGRFTLIVEGRPRTLGQGDIVVIPSGVEHAGMAETDCRLIDIFHPVREDYRFE